MAKTDGEQMLQLVEYWAQSGLTKKEFSRQQNMSYDKFKYWCDKFGHIDKKLNKTSSEFVRLEPKITSSNLSDRPIEIIYPNGIRMYLDSSISIDILRSLIQKS